MIQLFTVYSDILVSLLYHNMNYVSYVTYFGNVFCIFIGNNNQQERKDKNSVYIVMEKIKNVLRQKTPRLFNVAVCNNVHYTNKYRKRYFLF